jgi:hypothetical protein
MFGLLSRLTPLRDGLYKMYDCLPSGPTGLRKILEVFTWRDHLVFFNKG